MATVASLVVNLTANTSRLEKAFGRSQSVINNFVKSTKSVTRQLDEIARYGTKAGLGLTALSAATMGFVRSAGNHEEAMLRVKAVSQATRAEFDQLSKSAINLSTTTVHSLSSIEESMKFLGMAGYKANEIISLMPTIARMATAGGAELAETADITTRVLKGYAMGIEDVGRATDVLAMAMISSNNTLKDLGEAFKHAGSVAKSAGVEFETTAAIIALLGDAGIKGSIAGTSLKSAISRLVSPSASAQRILRKLKVETLDATGELRDMTDIIGQLQKAGAKTSDLMTIFGMRAGPSMARLVSMGSDALGEYVDKLRQSEGIAALIESEQMQSLNAQLQLTKGQLKALTTEIGNDFLPAAKTVNHYMKDMVKWFRGLDDETKQNIYRIGLMTAAVLGIVTVFGVVAGALSIIIKGFTVFGIILGLVTSGPVLAILGVAAAVGLLKTVWDENMGGIQDKTKVVMDKIQEYFRKFHTWWNGVPAVTEEGITSGFEKDIPGFKHKLLSGWEWTIKTSGDAWKWITETTWAEKWQDIKGWLTDGWKWTINKVGEGWDWFLNRERVQDSIDFIKRAWGGLLSWWNGVPAITPEGITSGFDVDQPGFKHKLLEIKDAIVDVWRQPFGELEMSVPQIAVAAGLATLAAVGAWEVLPWVFPGLSVAITRGIKGLALGGLVLGKIAVASLVLALAAGAIGWAFGDKEGRAAFVDAVKESIDGMDISDAVTIPVGVMDILTITFEFGTEGLGSLREKVQGAIEQVKLWEPAKMDAPEWLSDIGGSLWGLVLSMSEFLTEGLLLVFDIGELIARVIEKAIGAIVNPAIDLGKAIGRAIYEGLGLTVPEWLQEGQRGIDPIADYEGNLNAAVEFIKTYPRERWEDMANVVQTTHDVLESDVLQALGLMQPATVTDYERTLLAALVQLEDGVNGLDAMVADVEVVFNRLTMHPGRYGSSIEEVIRKPGQFEPVGSGALDELMHKGNITAAAFEAVDTALANIASDIYLVPEALYFANLEIVRQRDELAKSVGRPYAGSWMLDPDKMQPVLIIGDTTYGKPGPGYSSGTPWTGSGPLDEFAGFVHRQEAVIPYGVLKNGAAAVLEFLGMSGFATGKKVNIPGFSQAEDTVETMQTMFDGLGEALLEGLGLLFDLLISAVETVAVSLVGEEKVEEIKATFEEYHKGIQGFVSKLVTGIPKPEPEDEKETWFTRLQDTINEWKGALGERVVDFGTRTMEWVRERSPKTADFLEGARDAVSHFAGTLDVGAEAQNFMNSVLQQINPVAQLFAMLLKELSPAIETLMVPVSIVAEVLGLILMPVLEMLFPVLKLFGMAVTKVALVFGKAWNALAKVINRALGWLGVNLPVIDTDKIEENYKKLAGLEWDDLIKGANDTSEALRNVPQGLKIVANRMAAAGYQSMANVSVAGVNAVGRSGGSGQTQAGDTYQITIEGPIFGIDDLDRHIEKSIARAQRNLSLATNGV